MITLEAFKIMIAIPGIGGKIGVHRSNVSKYRQREPSVKRMEELLGKAGWTKEPEQWCGPQTSGETSSGESVKME